MYLPDYMVSNFKQFIFIYGKFIFTKISCIFNVLFVLNEFCHQTPQSVLPSQNSLKYLIIDSKLVFLMFKATVCKTNTALNGFKCQIREN